MLYKRAPAFNGSTSFVRENDLILPYDFSKLFSILRLIPSTASLATSASSPVVETVYSPELLSSSTLLSSTILISLPSYVVAASLPSARRKKLPSVAERKAEAPMVYSNLLDHCRGGRDRSTTYFREFFSAYELTKNPRLGAIRRLLMANAIGQGAI
jgi:hypothetical protein